MTELKLLSIRPNKTTRIHLLNYPESIVEVQAQGLSVSEDTKTVSSSLVTFCAFPVWDYEDEQYREGIGSLKLHASKKGLPSFTLSGLIASRYAEHPHFFPDLDLLITVEGGRMHVETGLPVSLTHPELPTPDMQRNEAIRLIQEKNVRMKQWWTSQGYTIL